MKRLISVLLTVCIVITAMSAGFVVAFAANTIDGTEITWSVDNTKKLLTISGSGAIPNYDDYKNELGQIAPKYPWYGRTYTAVEISGDITAIGNYAFLGSKSLKTVTITDSVKSIGKGVFLSCEALESVKLPADVQNVSESLFSNCQSLKEVVLPAKATAIETKAFYNCSSLENIDLPEGVTLIGESAFAQCTALKSIRLPAAVTEIGKRAFFCCEELKSVEMNDGLKTIGTSAFDGCSALTSVKIPEGVSVIAEDTFSGCSALASVELPSTVTELKDRAFNICPSLKEITLSQYIEKIGTKALGYGRLGRKVTGFKINGYEKTYAQQFAADNGFEFNSLGFYTSGKCGENAEWKYDAETKTLTVSGEGAMADCTADKLPYYLNHDIEQVVAEAGITRIGNYAFYEAGEFTLTVKSDEIAIGDYAFYNAGNLTAVTLGKSVTAVGEKAFGSFDKDGKIDPEFTVKGYADTAAEKYAEDTGCKFVEIIPNEGSCGEKATWFYDSEKKLLTIAGEGKIDDCTADKLHEYSKQPYTAIEISDAITAIGAYAFFDTAANSVTVPKSVTAVGEKALGYVKDAEGKEVVNPEFTVKGYKDSAAEKYAKENGLKFESLDEPDVVPEFGFDSDEFVKDNDNKIIYCYTFNKTAEELLAAKSDKVTDCAISGEGKVANGAKLSFTCYGKKYEYTLIIIGDVNCDGDINSSDALAILNHVVDTQKLDGVGLAAADVDANGELNSADALTVLQVAVGQVTLESLAPDKAA